MDKLNHLAANIEDLRQKIYELVKDPTKAPDPEVLKLNQDLDRLIVKYTKLATKKASE